MLVRENPQLFIAETVGSHLEQQLTGKLSNRNFDLWLGNLKEVFAKIVAKSDNQRSEEAETTT